MKIKGVDSKPSAQRWRVPASFPHCVVAGSDSRGPGPSGEPGLAFKSSTPMTSLAPEPQVLRKETDAGSEAWGSRRPVLPWTVLLK